MNQTKTDPDVPSTIALCDQASFLPPHAPRGRDIEANVCDSLSFAYLQDPAFPDLYFRNILPSDRKVIEELHEEWFPVKYEEEFYNELVYGRMCHSGDPLYTCLAIHKTTETIVGCLVGCFMKTTNLSKKTQELLVSEREHFSFLFYIMTLGTIEKYRRTGLGTLLIRRCTEMVEKERRCGGLYLHVITYNNSAINFYHKLKFHRVTEIENYYKIDGKSYNCYLYSKDTNGKNFVRWPIVQR